MSEGRASGRGPWRRTTARLAPLDRSAEVVGAAPIEVELWESADRAYLRSQAGTELLTELSAGPYYLREHDHRNRHQVLRTGFGTQQGLDIVRQALPADAGRLSMGAALASSLGVTVQLAATKTATAEPPISRPKGYTWELYAHRELGYIARILQVDLPAAPARARFEVAFLYGSAWLDELRVHVVWAVPELGEVELVVMATRPEALPVSGGDAVSMSGPMRSLDLRAESPGLATEVAALLPLEQIVAVEEEMPRCEMPSGRILLRGAASA